MPNVDIKTFDLIGLFWFTEVISFLAQRIIKATYLFKSELIVDADVERVLMLCNRGAYQGNLEQAKNAICICCLLI